MSSLSVSEALRRVLDGIEPRDSEVVKLGNAGQRVLAEDLTAGLTQPPFNASAMDGYAVKADDILKCPVDLTIIGEAAAGHGFAGELEAQQAVRIFTGAPVPPAADTIVIQELTDRRGNKVTIKESADIGAYIRPQGYDFQKGDTLLKSGTQLNARTLSLAAAMNCAEVKVTARPRVAVLATGDELVFPGAPRDSHQIVSSTPYGLAMMIEAAGGIADLLGIADDTADSLKAGIARASEADILVTIGGASVGDHDLVQDVLRDEGLTLDFWKIAMRPGKPLMYGRLGQKRVLGLPGNPVSALVCGRVFLFPLVRKMAGSPQTEELTTELPLSADIEPNGPREHFMRAELTADCSGRKSVAPLPDQDSSLLASLARADLLIIRPPHGTSLKAGTMVPVMNLDF